MTTQITVAPALLAVGEYGPYPSASAVVFSPSGWIVNFTNAADWPATGPVAVVTIEVRVGSTWQFDASIALEGPWLDETGATVNAGMWQASSPPNGNGIRVSINMLQAATLGLTVST